MKGTVNIQLEDFLSLLGKEQKAKELKERMLIASGELEVFLSFILTRKDDKGRELRKLVDEYNRQSRSSRIRIIDGKAKIELLGNSGERDT